MLTILETLNGYYYNTNCKNEKRAISFLQVSNKESINVFKIVIRALIVSSCLN